VLYADVHALFNVAIADDLVDDDTNGMGGDIVHDTGPSVRHIRGLGMAVKLTRTDPW